MFPAQMRRVVSAGSTSITGTSVGGAKKEAPTNGAVSSTVWIYGPAVSPCQGHAVNYILCTVYYILCTVYYVLYTVYCMCIVVLPLYHQRCH